jgi:hypothetical protein
MSELHSHGEVETISERSLEPVDDNRCIDRAETSRSITAPMGTWAGADAIFARLAASGTVMSDTVELIREDRQR